MFLSIIITAFLFSIPNAFGLSEDGVNYNKVFLGFDEFGNKLYSFTEIGYERILVNGIYKDFKFTETADYLQVETMSAGSVRLDKNTCEFIHFGNGVIGGKQPKLIDSIIPYQQISGSGVWNIVNQINDEVCNASWNGSELIAEKQKTGIGKLQYVYKFLKDKWKTELRITNNSGLNNRIFGFEQVFDYKSDSIIFGGSQKNLDNYDGQIFNRTWLENNEGKIIDFLNNKKFDFDKGFDNLNQVLINDTGTNSSLLTFQYFYDQNILPNGVTLVIDPTFSDSSANSAYADGGVSGADCDTLTVGGVQATNAYTLRTGTGYCEITYAKVDISSITDTGVTIQSGYFTYGVSTFTQSHTQDCLFRHMANDPDTLTNQQIYDQALAGTTITTADSNCRTVGGSYYQNLTTAGFTALKTSIDDSDGFFAFSFYTESIDRDDGSAGSAALDTPIKLTFVYSVGPPPDVVDDLTYDNLDSTSLDLLWTHPELNGGNLTTYLINMTTPHGDPTTVIAYQNTTYYNVTDLTFGTDYSFRVTAITENGGNITAPLALILNITTSTITYDTPPSLTVNDCYHTCTTQLNLEFPSSTMDNINGYRIQREINGGGFSTLVSNTTTPTEYYNNTGLSKCVIYNYRIYALNQSGISTASNEYAFTAHTIPDIVNDLTATPTSLSSIELEWTEPTHCSTGITGYQINFTTPEGEPLTIITNDTGTDAVLYEVTGFPIGSTNSFRVAANTEHTPPRNVTNISGVNATIANATTISEFTIGALNLPTDANTGIFPVLFTETNPNSTTVALDVRYPDTSQNFRCNFAYRFAQTNQTYSNFANSTYDANYVNTTFVFYNFDNEIIDATCWDYSNQEIIGYHTIQQSTIPFVTQVELFEAGNFGTDGTFGAIDFIPLVVIIISMIGFNKENPAVGLIIATMILGGAAFFGLIELESTLFGVLALVVMVGIIITKSRSK